MALRIRNLSFWRIGEPFLALISRTKLASFGLRNSFGSFFVLPAMILPTQILIYGSPREYPAKELVHPIQFILKVRLVLLEYRVHLFDQLARLLD